MSHWPTKDMLLKTPLARTLYHDIAAALPIIDYHCHLSAADLATDRAFPNLAQLWITTDPYKHRAMRIAGVPERLITGDARASSDREKFDAWAATVPLTLGNPLCQWTAMELQRYFGIDEPLSPASADRVWDAANARLATLRARALLAAAPAPVECLCTSDRLLDDLSAHTALAASLPTRVLPSLRADDVLAVDTPGYRDWLKVLGADSFATFLPALRRHLDRFAAAGCRLSDHALDSFRYTVVSDADLTALFDRCASGASLTADESLRLKSGLLRLLGIEYARRGWIMQLHIGAQRHTSSRLRRLAGPAGGYAAADSPCDIPSLCRFLDDLEQAGGLPRTILYPLNPADTAAFAMLTGSYAEDGVPGKIQLGPAWWWNDHVVGIRQHLDCLASYGLLSTFIGMTTDSRSLLSMTRHELFRRVFCDYIGDQVQAGAWPSDPALLESLVRRVGYTNAREFLYLNPERP